jgi:hypothetical protein
MQAKSLGGVFVKDATMEVVRIDSPGGAIFGGRQNIVVRVPKVEVPEEGRHAQRDECRAKSGPDPSASKAS